MHATIKMEVSLLHKKLRTKGDKVNFARELGTICLIKVSSSHWKYFIYDGRWFEPLCFPFLFIYIYIYHYYVKWTCYISL